MRLIRWWLILFLILTGALSFGCSDDLAPEPLEPNPEPPHEPADELPSDDPAPDPEEESEESDESDPNGAPASPDEPDVGPTSGLLPNELGSVMVLMYHGFGDADSEWVRSYDGFRSDLEYLYQEGYRPVSLSDYLAGTIDLPKGMTPVLLTFDDGLESQLQWEGNQVGRLADDTAVKILLDFAEDHPGFETRGVLYLNSPRPFYPLPEADIAPTLQWLVDQGFELGNHTHYHASLRESTDQEVQRAIALTQALFDEVVPEAEVQSLALPYGLWPEERSLAYRGRYQDLEYAYEAVMLVGAEPASSPFSRQFSPRATPRIRACEEQLPLWFGSMEQNPDRRYVSDGKPDTITVPRDKEDALNLDAVGEREVHFREESGE